MMKLFIKNSLDGKFSKILTIEDIKNTAKERGGICLSDKYMGYKKYHKWQCKYGHIWEATPQKVRSGSWCHDCAGNKKLNISKMHELAELKEGKCFSSQYTNARNPLTWKCKNNHIWKARPNDIRQGQWCPICSSGISERICRQFFEVIFNLKFPKIKPKWLKNSRGNLMELDGYCEQLNIAFEYHGRQHFMVTGKFTKKNGLKQRKEDDLLKRTTCKEKGIILIEVPYTIDFESMGNYILKKLKEKGIIVKKTSELDHKLFDIYSPDMLKKSNKLAGLKNGFCISDKYINARSKMRWKCEFGHIWEQDYDHIRRGKWCPDCSGNRRLTIEIMQQIAREKGGECLSKIYKNIWTKLKWKCSKGHIFGEISRYVKDDGKWCPYCSRLNK